MIHHNFKMHQATIQTRIILFSSSQYLVSSVCSKSNCQKGKIFYPNKPFYEIKQFFIDLALYYLVSVCDSITGGLVILTGEDSSCP